MNIRITFFILLIIFNLISLYFIIELFSYDEIVGYMSSGLTKVSKSRGLAYLLFMTSLFNLYFFSFVAIENSFRDKV